MSETMFQRVGGRRGIRSAVNGFYVRTLRDQRVAPFFEGKDIEWILQHQYKVFAAAAGGRWDENDEPLPDLADYMRKSHEHLGITDEHFDVVAGHLVATLDAEEWPEPDKQDFLTKVVSLKPVIVSA